MRSRGIRVWFEILLRRLKSPVSLGMRMGQSLQSTGRILTTALRSPKTAFGFGKHVPGVVERIPAVEEGTPDVPERIFDIVCKSPTP